MKVNFDYATNEVIVRLSELESIRLTAVILRETHGVPDPDADNSAQLEDALMELLA